MNNERYTENDYEQTLIQLFQGMGYQYVQNMERDYTEPYYRPDIEKAIRDINGDTYGSVIPHTHFDENILQEALRKLTSINDGTLAQRNEVFMQYLQNGVPVSYREDGREHTSLVKLIDARHPERNDFQVVNQYRMEEHENIRCDLVVLVNGLPLVVIELKSPSRGETDESDAYKQIKHYQEKCPSLFVYNAFNVISDMVTSKAGTITAPEDRYMEWKSKDGDYITTAVADYRTFFEGIFDKRRFIDILQNFLCYDHKDGRTAKVMCAYHQYYAVNRAIESANAAYQREDGKGGVFWHTQGSGKSFSMVFFVHKIVSLAPGMTVVVVTDRNDLDQQLYAQFAGCTKFLKQEPQWVGYDMNDKGNLTISKDGGRDDLKNKLKDIETNGIIFTTIQKFDKDTGLLSDRKNILVITDEAHRSQYGEEHWDAKDQKMKKGFALLLREALPNAIFVGFTGTPIAQRDRDTKEVFGNYIDVYDMTQAVADGATKPVYYESRVMNLNLDEEAMSKLDKEFDELAEEGATDEQINKARQDHSGLRAILCNENTIRSLCDDIIKHYEENRQYELTGKAMIVAYNKEAAVKIYRRIMQLRPTWKEKVRVVVSSSNTDNPEWSDVLRPKKDDGKSYWTNSEFAALFKDDNSPMKIAIVVDMWLTGFDVPSLATMYVYKPMKGHNLMQAIARVNRVFPEKEGGLIVDYVGIAQALKQAMQDYTSRDKLRFGDPDISKTACVKFQEKLEICRDLLHGYDYQKFFEGSNPERADVITGGVNFLLSPKNELQLKNFKVESQLLHNAETLCRSLLSKENKIEAAYMDAVRVMIVRLSQKGKVSKKDINERISRLLEQSIQSGGVINLFENKEREFSLFDESFVAEVKKMKEKNIAAQLLENLLKERIRKYERTNVVQSKKFSEMMNDALSNYLKGMLTNEQVIEELLALAQAIKESEEKGNELGLNTEEKAFYDALSSPEGVRQAYTDEEFVALTKELTEQLNRNKTIDWNKKETSRAKMRVMVKRLLKKYKYPPEGQEQALETVMAQCNKWADDEDNLE